MLDKFIKKSSKFFAVLLTVVLVFTQLGYAIDVTVYDYADLYNAINTETSEAVNADIQNDITAASELGTQASSELKINGNGNTIDGDNNAGMTAKNIVEISNVEISSFSSAQGGAVVVSKNTGDLTVKDSTFTYNSATGFSGAIHVSGTADISDSEFSNNEAAYGGAITAGTSSDLTITNTNFINNAAEEMGALGIYKNAKIDGAKFEGNSSTTTIDGNENMGSGAVGLGAVSTTEIKNSIFNGNASGTNGGAIGTRKAQAGDNSGAKLDIKNSTFTSNTATINGGAIDNYFYNSEENAGSAYIGESYFEGNTTTNNGGAIYNHGELDRGGNIASMKIEKSTFTLNTATVNGGAIYNAGKLDIDESYFENNQASQGGAIVVSKTTGELTVKNSTFTYNKSIGSEKFSGAIHVSGTADISNSEFSYNTADYAGAITAGTLSNLTITNTNFISNIAKEMGALGIYKNAQITGAYFEGNEAIGTTDYDENMGSGAIGLGSDSTVTIDDSYFYNNISETNGGAIGTRKAQAGNNTNAKLDIKNSTFTANGNTSTLMGGAIDNYFYNSETSEGAVYVGNSYFYNNQASTGGAIYNHGELDRGGNIASMKIEATSFENNQASQGGAIYNAGNLELGEGVSFSTNTATISGGAIYNNDNSTIIIGDNSNFSYNKTSSGLSGDNGGAIYNAGSLEIGEGAVFSTNTARSRGGAIHNVANSTMTIADNAKFEGNSVGYFGGAISNVNSKVTIGDNVQFISNIGSRQGGAIHAEGGATKIEIGKNAQFISNKANTESGGAIYIKGGANLTIDEGAIFSGNSGPDGGAILNNHQSTLNIKDDAVFSSNTATKSGGAIHNVGAHSTMNLGSVTFSSNTAGINGGAVYNTVAYNDPAKINFNGPSLFEYNVATSSGGAIYNYVFSEIRFYDSAAFVDNMANGVANDIYNDGKIWFSSGTVSGISTMTGGILGQGTTTIKGASLILGNDATLGQQTLSILEDGSLIVNVENLDVADSTITNYGELELFSTVTTPIDLQNNINGDNGAGVILGTTTVRDADIVVGLKEIQQSNLNVLSNSTMTVNAAYLTIRDKISNDGLMNFTGGQISADIEGDGIMKIVYGEPYGTDWVQAYNSITQNKIEIMENATFDTCADGITTQNGILNNGYLNFVSEEGEEESTNENEITGQGELTIKSGRDAIDFKNNANITQSTVTISSPEDLDTKFTNSADYTITANEFYNETKGIVTNEGTINVDNFDNLGSLTNSGVIISTNVVNSSTVVNSGTLTVYENVNNSSGTITNEGIITANGDLDSSYGTISNEGLMTLDGDLDNSYGLITNKNLMTIGGDLDNSYGIITNEDVMTVTGDLDNSYGTIVSSGTLTVGDIDNNEGVIVSSGSLTARDITSSGIIASSGTLTAGNIINSGIITSSGTLTATNILNENGALITNSEDGQIYSDNDIQNKGTIISNADGMKAVVNNMGEDSLYEITGGTISYAVIGDTKGTVNISSREVTVGSIISQNFINLSTGMKLVDETNLKTSTLTINNGAILNTINDNIGTVNPATINIADNANWNYQLDVDLELATADNLVNISTVGAGSQATIDKLNLLSDKAQTTSIQIADANINAITNPSIYTTNIQYKVTARNESDSTWLDIIADGYGGLANAIYDGANLYSVTQDTDYVTAWIEDPEGTIHNILKADLSIEGNNRVLTSTTGVQGIEVSTQTLKISNLAEFSGFTKHYLYVDEGGTLNVSSVTFKNANANEVMNVIANHGTTTLSDVTFADNNTLNNSGIIANGSIGTLVLSSVTFTNNINDADVKNDGQLILTGESSIFENGITGTGITTIDGVDIDMGDALMVQNRINISDNAGSSLTAKVQNLTKLSVTTELIMNHGELSLVGGEADVATLATEVNGIGNTELSNKVEVATNISQNNVTIKELAEVEINDNDGKIKADQIEIEKDATLKTNAYNIDTLAADGKIKNNGTLEFTDGTNRNKVTGAGEMLISGDVTNALGTLIEQSTVTITNKFTTNASDIFATKITNDGTLTFVDGMNTSEIEGTGDLVITGNQVINDNNVNITQSNVIVETGILENYGVIVSTNMKVENGATLIAHNEINTWENGGQVTNDGTLKIDVGGDMENYNIISGAGEMIVTNTEMTNAAEINQSKITIDNSAILKSTASIITADVRNDGQLIFDSGLEGDNTGNIVSINGEGQLIIDNGTILTNTTNIAQSTITVKQGCFINTNDEEKSVVAKNGFVVENDGAIQSNASALLGAISNDGVVEFTKGLNSNNIEGNGYLNIAGDVTNSAVSTIKQNEIDILADGEFTNNNQEQGAITANTIVSSGTFTTNASAVVTEIGIINDGTLNYTGGVNTSTITTTSTDSQLNIKDSLVNTAAIEQFEVNVESGTFRNMRGSEITAINLNLADEVLMFTDAGNLHIEEIELAGDNTILDMLDDSDASLTANITGNGLLVKEGTGIVNLTGTNEYAGTTTISNGAIEISSADNIGENTIFMDGGTLIKGDDGVVSLANEITATEGSDINIEVSNKNSALYLSNVINQASTQNANFVKTGKGAVIFADSTIDTTAGYGNMEENFYNGDTIVEEGWLYGTTKNINGKLIGSKADKENRFTFYDHDSDVVLNEIDSTDYIGTFAKVGNSTMTVTNNFHSVYAGIEGGTFIINNDSEMGGSGTEFIVDSTMTVTNSLLKGYGDIKVGELIIDNGATFAPGCSTTTFKQDGDLTFKAGGNYDVEFSQLDMDKANEVQTNDKTIVTGTTSIDQDAKITLNNLEGKYYVHETMNLIESGTLADGVDYKLENVTFNDNDAIDLRAGYDTRISTRVYSEDNKLKIDLARKASEYENAVEFSRSHNEQEAAEAIDAISTGNGGDITAALDTLEKFYYYESTYDINALKDALNDVAGVIHANSAMLTFTNAKIEHVYDKIQKRSIDLFPCTKFHDKLWAEYYYNTYNVKENENSPKFDTSVNGFLVGFDMISAYNWTVGAMAGYGTSELKQRSDRTNMKDINLGFYGGYENDNWLFKGMLLGGYEQYSTDRDIRFMDRMATSEHNGYSAALDIEAGYKIALNSSTSTHRLTLKPYVGITGSYINQEGFEEKGAKDLNLKVESYDNFSAQARLGIGINGKTKKFGWYAKAGIRELLTEDYAEIESSLLNFKDETKMKIRSAELDKFSYGGGIGADYALSDAWKIFANGLVSFADKSNNYYGNIGVMFKFGCINDEAKMDEDIDEVAAMLNEELANKEAMKKELANKNKEIEQKDKELQELKDKEKQAQEKERELNDRIQKYEANVITAEQAQRMKAKTVKSMRLEGKPTFRFGTDTLTGNGKESLRQVAREIEKYPDADVLIEGHTDSTGSDQINQKISENRAALVAKTLKKDYDVKNPISVIGKGKDEPIASNKTKEGRAKNRRVEIILTTAE